jgi:hypothetical protein
VRGKYVEFTVDAASFGVHDWTLTGAPNARDITGGRRTAVFASKTPDHRGLSLTSGISVDSHEEALVISRSGPGLTMKIQVKDCANGGVFQMEIERDDNTATVFTHTLADGVFYFDNPNVRDRLGERIPCSGILPDGTPVVCNGANPDGTVTVTARVNFGNDFSNKFVGRDSPQVATRIATGCPNDIPNPFHPGSVNHCGGISQWSVSSGGRMGQVMGEDAVEIAPAATVCTENCTAQSRVNGLAVVVGFPFPVPAAVRLQPRFPGATAPQLTSAVSRKNHGSAGAFDINLPLTGAPGVESRNSAGNHTLAFTFCGNIVGGSASATNASISGAPIISGNTMTVNLTGVPNAQKVTVTLSGVNDGSGAIMPDTAVTMGVLAGDSNGDSSVNAGDALQTRNRSGQAVDATNCRTDFNLDGVINAGDALLARAQSGSTIPQ